MCDLCPFSAGELSECLVDGAAYDISDNVLKFSASMLSIDHTPVTFYFYAQMSSDDGQNVVQLLPVTVVLGDRPLVSIRCLANCPSNSKRPVDVTTALLLVADCVNCASDERLNYHWTVDSAGTNPSVVTPFGRRGKRLAVDVRSLNRSIAFHAIHLTGLRRLFTSSSQNLFTLLTFC